MGFLSSLFSSGSNLIGVAGLALAAGSAFLGNKEAKARNSSLEKATEARNQAAQEQRKQNSLRLRREKRKSIRESRILRAQAVSRATTQNAQGSVSGAFGSIQSQLGGNLEFLRQSTIFANAGSSFLAESAAFGSQATQQTGNIATLKSITSAGISIFNKREALQTVGSTIFRGIG